MASPWTRDPPPHPQQAIALAPVVQQLRIAMTEHYLHWRWFPSSVEQLELPLRPSAPGIEAWSVSPAGVIELRLAPGQADAGGRLYQVAQVGPMGITWNCVAETVQLAARAPGCTHVAGFVPPTVVAANPPSLGPVPTPQRLTLRKTDGTVVEDFAWNHSSPEAFERLDTRSRRDVIAALLRANRLQLEDRHSVQAFSSTLAGLGKPALPALEEALADAEGATAVAVLVAACRIEMTAARPLPMSLESLTRESRAAVRADAALAALEACMDTRAARGRAAADLVLAATMTALKSPERERLEPELVAFDEGNATLAMLSALAAHARPKTEALIPLLEAYPTHLRAGDAALVGRVLLRLGLADAAAPDAAALAEEGLARMFAGALQAVGKAASRPGELPEPSAATLAARVPWTATLEERFAAVARREGSACEQVDGNGIRSLGPHSVRAILHLTGAGSTCRDLQALGHLLAEMLRRHPDAIAQVPLLARPAASREVAVAVLLDLRSEAGTTGEMATKALATLGLVEVKIGKAGPVFPAPVRWPGSRVLKRRDLAAAQIARLPAPLRAALGRELSGTQCPGATDLSAVTELTIWSHPDVPVKVARIRCKVDDQNPEEVVYASIAPGNTVARVVLPARLNGMYESASVEDPITDVDGDGRPEIVTLRTIAECDGEEDCPEDMVYAYDFSELDDNRFTWFRNR